MDKIELSPVAALRVGLARAVGLELRSRFRDADTARHALGLLPDDLTAEGIAVRAVLHQLFADPSGPWWVPPLPRGAVAQLAEDPVDVLYGRCRKVGFTIPGARHVSRTVAGFAKAYLSLST